MLLVCNGNLGSPLSCGKPNVGQTNKPIPANRCSAVLRQQVGLRPTGRAVNLCAARLPVVSFSRPPHRSLASVTAALNGRICCWRLQPSGVCRAATVVAEVSMLQILGCRATHFFLLLYVLQSQQLKAICYMADASRPALSKIRDTAAACSL